MKFEDRGIVINAVKYGEKSLIVSIFTENNGLVKGMATINKKNLSIYQLGNLLEFVWQARLEEHLGKIKANLDRAYSLLCYHDFDKISAISSICSLTYSISQEKEQMKDFYDILLQFFEDITSKKTRQQWLKDYCLAELELLKWSGFGFDFSHCSVSGDEEIRYISPKTGAVVSEDVGRDYQDRLFNIPEFFLDYEVDADLEEIKNGLEITRYFIIKNFFSEDSYKMPNNSQNFIKTIFD